MNWKTAVDATSTALDSNGSAATENAKVLGSIEGHIQRLESEWENFSRKVVDDDLVKFVIDLGRTFLEFASSGVGSVLAKTAGLTTTFGALYVVFGKMYQVVKNANAVFKTLNKTTEKGHLLTLNLVKIKELQAKRDELDQVRDKKTIVTSELRNKLLSEYNIKLEENALASDALTAINAKLRLSYIGLVGAMSAASLILIGVVEAVRYFKEKYEESVNKMSEGADKLKDSLNDLDNSISNARRFREVLDDNSSSYEDATAAREELIKIQNELKKTYGEEAEDIDLVSGSIDEQIKKIKELKKEQAQAYLDNNRGEYEKAQKKTYGQNKYTRTISFKLNYDNEEIKKILNEYGEMWNSSGAFDTNVKWTTNSVEQSKKGLEELKKYYLEHEKIWIDSGKMSQEQFNEQYTYITGELDDINKDFAESYDAIQKYQEQMLNAKGYEFLVDDIKKLSSETALTEKNVQDLIDKYPGLAEAMKLNGKSAKDLISDYQNIDKVIKENVENINKSVEVFNGKKIRRSNILKIPDNKDASEEEVEAYNDLKKAADEAHISIEALINILVKKNAIMQDSGTYDEEMANFSNQWAESTKKLCESLESIDNAYKLTTEAQQEYNKYGFFSVETLDKLLKLDYQYIDALVDENYQIKNNVDWYKIKLEATLDEYRAKYTGIYYSKLLTIQEKAEELASLSAADAAYELAKAYGATGVSADILKEKIKKVKEELDGNENENVKKAVADATKEYKNYMALLDAAWAGIKKYGTSGYPGSSSSKSSGTQKEWWETAFDDLKDQYDNSEITINNYIDGLDKLLGKLEKGSKGWNKVNKELQKQRLDKIKDDYNAGRISLNQYITALGDLQKAYKEGTKEWNNLANAIKKAKLDKLKKDQDDLKTALDAVNGTLDKQIEKYEKLKDEVVDRYDKEIDGLEDVQDKLNDQDDEYQRAQKAVIKYLNEQLNALQDQKDAIDDYYDDVIDAVDKLNDEQEKSLELAEAYEALMNAMTQKTKKVWREGLGWVWEADQKAIADAKKTYDELIHSATIDEIQKQKEITITSLEEQIDALNDYVDSWDEVLDKYDNDKNNSLADKLLGENWQELASQLDPQVVKDFSDAYYELQKSLEETEEQIEELNKLKKEQEEYWDSLIKGVQEYKDKWGDVSESYQDAQNKLIANQVLIADWEKNILDQRLEALENFKNKYNTIMDAIKIMNNMSDDASSSYTPPTLQGYSNGGEVDYTGLAMLHGTPNRPEYVLNNDQMRNLLSNLTKPQVTPLLSGVGNSSINNYNFGNIELPNVNNAQQFISELKSLVNTTRNS